MATFTVPKTKSPDKEEINTFLGADLSNDSNNVDIRRSPSCPNMIRDKVGKVKKRDGIQLVDTFGTRGQQTYTITTPAVVGDTITINGVTFTMVDNGTDLVFE